MQDPRHETEKERAATDTEGKVDWLAFVPQFTNEKSVMPACLGVLAPTVVGIYMAVSGKTVLMSCFIVVKISQKLA